MNLIKGDKLTSEAVMRPKLSRRTALKTLFSTAVSTVLLQSGRKASAHDFKGYETNRGVLVDLTKCIGCRSCEAACNKEHGLPPPKIPFDDLSVFGQNRDGHTRRTDQSRYTVVNQFESPLWEQPLFKKIQCNHCLEPACLTACFVNAYTKTPEGAVTYNPEVCVGCRTCMVACPFSIPAFKYDSALDAQIMKCNFCFDTRLSNNQPPACVEACPMEALTFGYRKTLLRIARKRIRENPDNYVNYIYGETEAGGTSWLYLSPVPFDTVGFDTSVPKQPILNYVKDFLGMVPMVLTIWPALFAGIYLLAHRKNQYTANPSHEDLNDENHTG